MWNYRLCKETQVYHESSYVIYSIREVYYNPEGSVWAITENPITLSVDDLGGELDEIDCIADLKSSVDKIMFAFDSDVIDLDTFEYADRVDEG